MRIEILSIPGCPNLQPAYDALLALLKADSFPAEIRFILVSNNAQAQALQFPGSPTIRVNGRDVEPASSSTVAFACRIYRDGAGVPSKDSIRAAILGAARASAMPQPSEIHRSWDSAGKG